MARVLLLRPREAAERTEALLRARGHDVIAAPLLVIRPSGDPCPPGPFDGVVVTSANAFLALTAADLAPLAALPLLAVGERTAAAARSAGFAGAVAADGDRLSLAARAPAFLAPGARLLLVLGRDHKPDTPDLLTEAGFHVTRWIAYAAEAEHDLPPAAAAAVASGAVDTALHYSRRSAALALALARRAGCGEAFLALTHLCLSQDVAAPLVGAGAARVSVADRPDETALLALLPARRDT